MTTTDEVQQTLAEYERLAIETGEWNGTDAPEFSDGQVDTSGNPDRRWTTAWSPSEEKPFPAFARATVYRKGVERPIVVVVRWDEALPADDEWRALWLRKPTTLFGAFAIRASFRRGFRDVIGDRREPDEIDGDAAAVNADRDWSAELAEAESISDVQRLWGEARKARIVTVDLESAFRRRLQSFADRVSDKIPGAIVTVARPAETAIAAKSRPLPSIPTIRPEDTVRKPRKGDSRPQRQKPRGPRGAAA